MPAAFGTTALPTPPLERNGVGKERLVWGVTYDPSKFVDASGGSVSGNGIHQLYQQPVQQQIAKITAEKVADAVHGASGIAINPRFIVYVVKQGLIRVFHRHSSGNSLLRSHSGQTISDLQFFNDGDVLASVGYYSTNNGATPDQQNSARGGNVVISRIFERSASEIVTEQILEIRSDASLLTRVIWHPFNVNQFWMIHCPATSAAKKSATLVESTRLSTTPHPTNRHAVTDFATRTVLTEGGIVSPLQSGLLDLAWSTRDTRYVMAVYETGEIVLFDVKNTALSQQLDAPDGPGSALTAVPTVMHRLQSGGTPVTRCLFLPHERIDPLHYHMYHNSNSYKPPTLPWTTCFVTGSAGNSELTLWSPFAEGTPPIPLQVVQIASPQPTSYILNMCVGPNPTANTALPLSCFVTASSCEQGCVYAVHIAAQSNAEQGHPKALVLAGADYVVPFRTQFPMYSSKTVCSPPTDLPEEDWGLPPQMSGNMFDISVFAYQSAAVQCLLLTAQQCWPPSDPFLESTKGVTARWLAATTSSGRDDAATSDLDNEEDFEDYDVEDEEEEEEYDEAPDPSMLPLPGVALTSNSSTMDLQNNAFANWLGAMAAKTSTPSHPSVQSASSSHAPSESLRPLAPSMVSPPSVRTASAAPPPISSAFLSPMEILSGQPPPPPRMPEAGVQQQQNTSVLPNEVPTRGELENSNAAITSSEGRADVLKTDDIRLALQEVLHTTFVPLVKQTVLDTIAASVPAVSDKVQPLQASMDTLVRNGVTTDSDKIAAAVASSVHEQLRTAFSDNVRTVLIPTLESVSGQVIQQMAAHLEKTNLNEDGKLESISKQLTTMTQLVVELTKEVSSLRSMVVESRATANPPLSEQSLSRPPPATPDPTPAVDPAEAQRAQILALLRNGNYEDAFRAAVSNQTVEMTIFCCRHADLQQVFGGEQPVLLSQPILLCLMQQLGTVIVTSPNPQLELDWLQEIALSLNPNDLSIQRHVPNVLQQVATNIQQRISQSTADANPALRRPLQRMLQVVRGIQMG
jgi:hypothetical protein